MPKNEDSNKANRHELVLAMSGRGKSHLIKNRNPLMKKPRVIIWDPHKDHNPSQLHRTNTLQQFYLALTSQSDQGNSFKLAISLDKELKRAFPLFCKMVWQNLDGRKDTVIVIEELALVSHAGRAIEDLHTLIVAGRKYGAIIIATTQRAQEIDTTLFTQVNTKYIGGHEKRDADHLAKHCNVDAAVIEALQTGEFIKKESGKPEINIGKTLPTTGRPTRKKTKKPGNPRTNAASQVPVIPEKNT